VFYVTLCRLPRRLGPQERGARLRDSYQAALKLTRHGAAPDERPEKERGVAGFIVSPAERRLILMKRGLLTRAYSAAGRIRPAKRP
jgi:hypothetical protein